MSPNGKKLNHHNVWIEDDLHLYLTGLEFDETRRTGEEVGFSTLIRRIIRREMERSKAIETIDAIGDQQ